MLFKNFYNALSNYIDLTEEAYAALEERVEIKKLKSRDYLVREGETLRYLPFINEGLMLNYRIDDKGNQHVMQIRWTGWWLGDLYSFFSNEPTAFNIIAYKPTELLLLSQDSFEYITSHYPIYEKYFRIAFQKSYIGTLRQVYNLHSKTAEERYLGLVEHVPTILDDVPHYLIASFLNIRPQSLSRIRRKISSQQS